MKQYHIFVSGRVQGVGYRSFCQRQAERLGVSGWVRNLHDGRVEVMAAGREKNLKIFISVLRKGPFLSRVDKIAMEKISPVDTNLYGKFVRRPTV